MRILAVVLPLYQGSWAGFGVVGMTSRIGAARAEPSIATEVALVVASIVLVS
jgi:hypothetical protein